jgi:hypothetical protein
MTFTDTIRMRLLAAEISVIKSFPAVPVTFNLETVYL